MRLEEIAQLDPQTDVRQEAEVWVFDVNQANGKQLKNKWSKRLVPIHPALWSVGLRSYLESLKIRRATRLFPDTPEFEGRVGKNAGKAANRFIQQTVGVQGKTLHLLPAHGSDEAQGRSRRRSDCCRLARSEARRHHLHALWEGPSDASGGESMHAMVMVALSSFLIRRPRAPNQRRRRRADFPGAGRLLAVMRK